MELGTLSNLLVYGTVASYLVSLIAFAVDLSGFGKDAPPDRRRRAAGIAMSTAWLGLIFHVGAVVLRGIATQRAPWANMYEFTLVAVMFTVAVFLVVSQRRDVRYLGLPVTFLAVISLLIAITLLYVAADGVQPALQSYWLVIHVSVATLATGLFSVGALVSVLQIVRDSDERRRQRAAIGEESGGEAGEGSGRPAGAGADNDGIDDGAAGSAAAGSPRVASGLAHQGAGGDTAVIAAEEATGPVSVDLGGEEPEVAPARPTFFSRMLDAFPASESLERLAYRLNAVGLVGWTFVLVTGAIWAEYAWGRAWGWDPKETVSLVVWIVYAAYGHVRLTTGWNKRTFAYFSLAGFAALMFNYYGVNIFINSLHSYAGVG